MIRDLRSSLDIPGFLNAQAASSEQSIEGGTGILDQVEAIRHLYRLRRSGFGSLVVRSRPVPGDHLYARATFQPLGHRLSLASFDHIDRTAGL
jgi:hypothetical protein